MTGELGVVGMLALFHPDAGFHVHEELGGHHEMTSEAPSTLECHQRGEDDGMKNIGFQRDRTIGKRFCRCGARFFAFTGRSPIPERIHHVASEIVFRLSHADNGNFSTRARQYPESTGPRIVIKLGRTGFDRDHPVLPLSVFVDHAR